MRRIAHPYIYSGLLALGAVLPAAALALSIESMDEPALTAVSLPLPGPELSACPGGYFTAEVTDGYAADQQPGIFGIELLLDEPGTRLLQGGLNFGALIDAGQPGFAAVNIANPRQEPQRLNLRLYGSAATAREDEIIVDLRIERREGPFRETVYSHLPTLSLAQPFEASLEVTPGYYLAIISTHREPAEAIGGDAEGEFFFSLTTEFLDRPGGAFQGGAVVGGYHAPHPFGGVSGFAGFCLATAHSASAQVFSAPTYGESGAADLQLRLRDHRRKIVHSAPAGQFRNVVDQLEARDRPVGAGMVLGADGLPLLTYLHPVTNLFTIARCQDHACARRSIADFEAAPGHIARAITGLAIGARGSPILSYRSDSAIIIASCSDPGCAQPVAHNVIYTPGSPGEALRSADLRVAPDGLPAIAVGVGLVGVQPQFLPQWSFLLKCVDPDCSAPPLQSPITAPRSEVDGLSTQIEIGADGLPFIAYYNRSANELRTAHCSDPSCSGAITRSVVALQPRGSFDDDAYFDVSISADGNPLFFHGRHFGTRLRVARCQDPGCVLAARQNDLTEVTDPAFDLIVGDHRLPHVRYQPDGQEQPLYLRCFGSICGDTTPPPASALISTGSAFGTDGLPLFIYSNVDGELGVIKCGSTDCRP